MSKPLVDTNSPEFLNRVDHMSKVVNQSIGRFEESPQVVIPVLLRLLCVVIVSETFHLPKRQVIHNSIKSFRGALEEAFTKFEQVQARFAEEDKEILHD